MQNFFAFVRFLMLTVAWGAVGWGTCQAATAPNPKTLTPAPSYAGWLDQQGAATIDTVEQLATWERFSGWKSWGYGPEAVWLRIDVPAAPTTNGPPQILIVRPPYLDRVTFFDPASGAVRRSGDFFPAVDDALNSALVTFEVPAFKAARQVWIKMESSSARVVHLSLMPLAEAQFFTRWVEWMTGGLFLLSLVFLIWALAQWQSTRDAVMGLFAFKQFAITLWGFLFLGFARVTVGPWFAEGVLSLVSSTAVALAVSSLMWFFAALLVEYKARSWMLSTLRASGWLVLSLGLLNFMGLTYVGLRIINTVAPILLLWIVVTLWAARPTDSTPPISKSALLAYLCLYAVLNALPALTHTGWIPESPILFLGNMTLLVADGMVMLVMLNRRQRLFRERHQAVTTQLMQQQEQAQLDQQYLDEQRQLLSMLAHEMKTPLANLRIWMEAGDKGRPVMERAIHDMNRVIERCVHAGQLSDHSLAPRNEWLDVADLTQTVLSASRQPERVRLALPSDVCAVHTDAQMLSIVLSNLLENAYKYGLPGSPVVLRLNAEIGPQGETGWCWQVDNAVGVAGYPDPHKVFDKYYRSPHAQRQSGSGLGLYLVKSLLILMRGHVRYVPLDEGVRFHIWIPDEVAPLPNI